MPISLSDHSVAIDNFRVHLELHYSKEPESIFTTDVIIYPQLHSGKSKARLFKAQLYINCAVLKPLCTVLEGGLRDYIVCLLREISRVLSIHGHFQQVWQQHNCQCLLVTCMLFMLI